MAKSAALVRSEGEVERLRLELDRVRTELRSAQDEIAMLRKAGPKFHHAELMATKRAQAAELIAKYGVSNVRQIGGKFEVRIADAWGNPAV